MKWKFTVLGLLELVVALGAIPSGISMIARPDGLPLGLSTDLLGGSPFSNYLVPGIILLVFIGIGGAWGTILSFWQKPLAGTIGILLGVFLIGWILFQIYLIGYLSFLQPCIFATGVIVSGLGWLIARSKDGLKGTHQLPI